jgi:hypothetical protein
VIELVHGLLEAPLRVGADVPASPAAGGGHRRGADWRGIGSARDGDGVLSNAAFLFGLSLSTLID